MCTSNKQQRNSAFVGNLGQLSFAVSVKLRNRAMLPPDNDKALSEYLGVIDSVVCNWLYASSMDPSHVVLTDAQFTSLLGRAAYAVDSCIGMAESPSEEV